MNVDQTAHVLRSLAAVYLDAGDNSKAAGLQGFANLLAESSELSLAQWCKAVAAVPKKQKANKKATKRSKSKA